MSSNATSRNMHESVRTGDSYQNHHTDGRRKREPNHSVDKGDDDISPYYYYIYRPPSANSREGYLKTSMYGRNVASGYSSSQEEMELSNRNKDRLENGKNEGNPGKKKKGGFASIFDDFGDYISADGIPRVCKKDTRLPIRIFYGLIFLGSLSAGFYFGAKLIIDYYEYPVNVLVKVKTDTNLDFPAITICNTNRFRVGGIKETRDEDLIYLVEQNKGFGNTYYPPCLEGDFNCSEVCLRNFKVCDGIRDCPNWSDELICDYGDCGEFQFKCETGGTQGYCMPNSETCNGVNDCYDNSDEDPTECGEECNGFECWSGQCIAWDNWCNGYEECDDRSDEFNCTDDSCYGDDTWLCANGDECLYPSWVCDSYKDCSDGSDELNCGNTTAIPDDECGQEFFRCDDGECVWTQYVCDAIDDCLDSSDEQNCGGDVDDATGVINGRQTIDQLLEGNWYEQYLEITSDANVFVEFEDFFRDIYNSGFERVEDTDPPDWNGFVSFSATSDFSDIENVVQLEPSRIKELGHQAEDLIMQCSFDKKPCSYEDFWEFQDDKYGNCFTFNHPDNYPNGLKSSGPGSAYGLKLTLFTEQSEYVSIYGQESGAIISVHSRDIRPFPENNGVRASTGRATSIGLLQTVLSRKSFPFGNCTDEEFSELSMGYSLASCKKECVESYIYAYCGCVDTILYENKPNCNILNQTQERCRQLMYFLHTSNYLGCSTECREPCNEIIYSKSVSSSSWPSEIYTDHLVRIIHSLNDKTRNINDDDSIKQNLARVDIFFEEMTYSEITEQAKYEGPWDLMSEIGGVIGLYIGLSIITVIEFCELILLLVMYCFQKLCRH